MKIGQICDIIDASVICGEHLLDTEICSACGSDLMSDVLAYVKDQGVLLTGLVNLQVIRTAEMMDIHVIIFVRGKKPDAELVKFANEKQIALLCTEYPMYIACGKLYEAGLSGGETHR